jgi:drug/metabolite transporter (DMT)-like permease
VVIGFLGVLVMLSPHLDFFDTASTGAMLGSAAGLLAALFSAVSAVQIRHFARTKQPDAIVLYFSLITTVIGFSTIVFGWTMPMLWQFGFLLSAGICAGVAQILVTVSLRHAQASLLAPFEYTTTLLSVLIGYFALGQLPVATTFVGGVVVAAAGLFAVWRESRLKRSMQLTENALAKHEA